MYIQRFLLKDHCCTCILLLKYSVLKSTGYWRKRLILLPNICGVFFSRKKGECGVKREEGLVNQDRHNQKFFWNYNLSSEKWINFEKTDGLMRETSLRRKGFSENSHAWGENETKLIRRKVWKARKKTLPILITLSAQWECQFSFGCKTWIRLENEVLEF